MAIVRRRVVVHGRVQGVFFRESTRQAADAAGVSGWVRNLTDGTVEAVLEGPAGAVDELIAFCRQGPPQAHVDDVDVVEEDPAGVTSFTFAPTNTPGTEP